MILGIDASNLRIGGGVTHLVELLRAAKPEKHGFNEVVVWGGTSTLSQLELRPWLRCVHEPLLDRPLPVRLFWQRYLLDHLARSAKCTVLFVPGGSFSGAFRPFITMSRNMLPFESREALRYGLSPMLLRCILLRRVQAESFRKANGVVFLTQYAHDAVMKTIKGNCAKVAIIPHGVDKRFHCLPRQQEASWVYSSQHPIRVLYVSTIDFYKHQWCVVEAVGRLRALGVPIELDLIGTARPSALRRLERALRKHDPGGQYLHYVGSRPYAELSDFYHQADIFVYASSCENMPNILLEAMVAGLPIACSSRGPMPEMLGDAGVYFDPEKIDSISQAIKTLIDDSDLRRSKAVAAYARGCDYTWDRCAKRTFTFLRLIASGSVNPEAARVIPETHGAMAYELWTRR